MTLPDPSETIAPRDEMAFEPVDVLREMLVGAYPEGAVLAYYDLQLYSQHYEDGPRVWAVHAEDGTYIETLNLDTYRTVSELEDTLQELAACDPDDRADWVEWSR